MAGTEIYLYANCTSCKKADALLKEKGVDADRRDLFKQQLNADEIRALFARAGLSARVVLSTRSRPYTELGLADRDLSDDEIISLMAEHPALLRRPIVVKDGKAVIGFNRGAIETLVG
jgi:Spx/MgsR family transcriptional regulator